jgi:hypothetical protein
MPPLLRHWSLGAALGGMGVLLFFTAGSLSLIPMAVLTVAAATSPAFGEFVAGALAGVGAANLVVLALPRDACTGCQQPDLSGWPLPAALLLAAGIAGMVWQGRGGLAPRPRA